MITLPLSEVRVMVYQRDGTCPSLPLDHSPYYQTLVDGHVKVWRYYKLNILPRWSPGSSLMERSYRQFKKLARSIRRDGFDPSPPRVTFDEDGVTALDGQHRLSILLWLYGPNLMLEIENNEVMGIILPEGEHGESI